MGELHLEIIKDRLKTEYNITAHLSKMQVAYRESVEHNATLDLKYLRN
jgi:elongation factor G